MTESDESLFGFRLLYIRSTGVETELACNVNHTWGPFLSLSKLARSIKEIMSNTIAGE